MKPRCSRSPPYGWGCGSGALQGRSHGSTLGAQWEQGALWRSSGRRGGLGWSRRWKRSSYVKQNAGPCGLSSQPYARRAWNAGTRPSWSASGGKAHETADPSLQALALAAHRYLRGDGPHMSRSWAKGSTRAWRRTRARVLARDGYRCQLRTSPQCVGLADCVHHVAGKAFGDDLKLLVAACTPCNLKVGDPTKQPDPQPKPRTRW